MKARKTLFITLASLCVACSTPTDDTGTPDAGTTDTGAASQDATTAADSAGGGDGGAADSATGGTDAATGADSASAADTGAGGADAGGGDAGGSADAGGSDTGGGATATWAQVHGDILKKSCAGGYCHGGGAGSLKLTGDATTDYDAVTKGTAGSKDSASCASGSYVVAGKPEESLLWLKTDKSATHGCGKKMPGISGGLPQDQSDLIKAWIAAGAKP